MANTRIADLIAREVLDSRGNPTVEVEALLEDGTRGRAIVPSGASTGVHEVVELRDGDARFGGKGVLHAVGHVRGPLRDLARGMDAAALATLDAALRAADGTDNLARLGANAVLGVSLAAAHAAARAQRRPLFRFLAEAFGATALRVPVPMFNVLNGGAHADNGLDVQEIMIVPAGLPTFREALRAGAEVYHALKALLAGQGLSTAVGDEGGFAPRVESNGHAVELVAEAIQRAGYVPGEQVLLALDVAASEFHVSEAERADGNAGAAYRFDGRLLTAEELTEVYARWCAERPIYSIEDGLDEDDWAGWAGQTRALGDRYQLVGDDIFVTNTERLTRGIQEGVANSVLIKPNQIGTLTDTFRCVRTAYEGGFGAVISHRSGETEDTTIADLAVALGTGQIKTGAPCRGERTAKYNRLLRIEEQLEGEGVPFGFRAGTLRSAPAGSAQAT